MNGQSLDHENEGTTVFQDFINLSPDDTISHTVRLEPSGCHTCKVKGLPQQAEVAQGVPGRLRRRIFLTFGTTRVVGRQPYAPAAFTPGEIPGTHF